MSGDVRLLVDVLREIAFPSLTHAGWPARRAREALAAWTASQASRAESLETMRSRIYDPVLYPSQPNLFGDLRADAIRLLDMLDRVSDALDAIVNPTDQHTDGYAEIEAAHKALDAVRPRSANSQAGPQ